MDAENIYTSRPPANLEPVPVANLGNHNPFPDDDEETVIESGREVPPGLVKELVEDVRRGTRGQKSGK